MRWTAGGDGSTNATIPASGDPETITLEQASALIAERVAKGGGKKKKPAKKAKASTPKKQTKSETDKKPAKKKATKRKTPEPAE